MSDTSTSGIVRGGAVPVRTIEAFLYHEARLADEHRYDEWENLWCEEALYWVPIDLDGDPAHSVSYIYDNRTRIASRIRQLNTGRRHAQAPQSEIRRMLSNIIAEQAGEKLTVHANFAAFEMRRGTMNIWAGSVEYRLRVDGDQIRMAMKKIVLVNRGCPLPNLAFLI